jgi:Zn-dependent protease with chaperone function
VTTTIAAGIAATTTYTISTVSSASFHYGAEAASGGLQHRPNSLLTVLPGESVGSLIATLSPLLVGLLVAVLIYSAYSRRQDSSS